MSVFQEYLQNYCSDLDVLLADNYYLLVNLGIGSFIKIRSVLSKK